MTCSLPAGEQPVQATEPPTVQCIAPAVGEACHAEYQAWCDGACMSLENPATSHCATLCAANPDSQNRITCTPPVKEEDFPCFVATSPGDYPGVAYKTEQHEPTFEPEMPSCCNYDTQVWCDALGPSAEEPDRLPMRCIDTTDVETTECASVCVVRQDSADAEPTMECTAHSEFGDAWMSTDVCSRIGALQWYSYEPACPYWYYWYGWC